jgi:hypothetical protein
MTNSTSPTLARLQEIREKIGEQLVPALAAGNKRIWPQAQNDAELFIAVEQVIATYVQAFCLLEVARAINTEGRGVSIINGDYPIEVRTRE